MHLSFLKRFIVLHRCDKVTCALFSWSNRNLLCLGLRVVRGYLVLFGLDSLRMVQRDAPVTSRYMFVWVTKTTSGNLRCTLDQIMVGKSKQ